MPMANNYMKMAILRQRYFSQSNIMPRGTFAGQSNSRCHDVESPKGPDHDDVNGPYSSFTLLFTSSSSAGTAGHTPASNCKSSHDHASSSLSSSLSSSSPSSGCECALDQVQYSTCAGAPATRGGRGSEATRGMTFYKRAVAGCSKRLHVKMAEDCLWLASAVFIIYYGDFRLDFFSLLATDSRVMRTPLDMGLACLILDVCVVTLYAVMISNSYMQRRSVNNYMMQNYIVDINDMQINKASWDYTISPDYLSMVVVQAPNVLQVAIVAIGSTSFILMCIALWPIWSFLTVPMLFTLLTALITVVAPCIIVACTKLVKQLLHMVHYSYRLTLMKSTHVASSP